MKEQKKVANKNIALVSVEKTLNAKETSKVEIPLLLKSLGTTEKGLSDKEAHKRIKIYGRNEVVTEKRKTWFTRLLSNIKDPLSGLLLILGIISYFTGDIKSTVLIISILVLSVIFRYVQETRADTAAEKLKAMVHTTATVLRDKMEK